MPKIKTFPVGTGQAPISAILQQALYGKKKSPKEIEKERQEKRLNLLLGITPK